MRSCRAFAQLHDNRPPRSCARSSMTPAKQAEQGGSSGGLPAEQEFHVAYRRPPRQTEEATARENGALGTTEMTARRKAWPRRIKGTNPGHKPETSAKTERRGRCRFLATADRKQSSTRLSIPKSGAAARKDSVHIGLHRKKLADIDSEHRRHPLDHRNGSRPAGVHPRVLPRGSTKWAGGFNPVNSDDPNLFDLLKRFATKRSS